MFGNFLFGKRAQKPVGIDIGSHYVKLIALTERQENKFQLNAFAIERLNDESRETKIAAIKKVIQESGVTSDKVNISVCGPSVVVRYILVPQMTRVQLESAIRYEAEKYIPFDIQDVVLNAPILEEKREDGKIRVLIVAAKKAFIEETVRLVEDCGLEPQLIDVDSFALINSFLLNNPGKESEGIVALLHIGANFTSVNILKNKVSHFMRDIAMGGKELTKVIGEKLNLDEEAAEKLKCDPGAREEEVFSIISPALNNLLGEVSLSFSYYEDQLERGIDKIYISGGTAKLKNIDRFLSTNLGMEVVTWDPTAKFEIKSTIDQQRLKSCFPMLPVCAGLALSSPEKR